MAVLYLIIEKILFIESNFSNTLNKISNEFYFSMNGCVVVSIDGSNSLSNNKKAEMATLAQSQSKQSLLDLRQQSEDSLFVITLQKYQISTTLMCPLCPYSIHEILTYNKIKCKRHPSIKGTIVCRIFRCCSLLNRLIELLYQNFYAYLCKNWFSKLYFQIFPWCS